MMCSGSEKMITENSLILHNKLKINPKFSSLRFWVYSDKTIYLQHAKKNHRASNFAKKNIKI